MGTKRAAGKMDRTGPQDQKVAVIWTRVSTKEQADNNLSLETQEKACRDYAERNGIEIDCIKGNTNESAKTEGKLFREMIAYVSLHKRVNTILVYSLDRFSRTGPEAMVTKEYLKSKGINIISVTQPIDNNNAAGAFMENIIFLFSQFENNLRKDKCTAGMIACPENGDWYSAPPVGYQIDRTAGKKLQLLIDEKGPLTAPVIQSSMIDGMNGLWRPKADKGVLEGLSPRIMSRLPWKSIVYDDRLVELAVLVISLDVHLHDASLGIFLILEGESDICVEILLICCWKMCAVFTGKIPS